MTLISYEKSPSPVRDDLRAAHERLWRGLAQPGNWWNAAERVAIAGEVRNAEQCRLCAERRDSLSAAAVVGDHDAGSVLPAAAIEAVHKIVTDTTRLSRRWFDELAKGGLADGHYVELLGITVSVLSTDRFCRGMGVPLHPLPPPGPGEPSHKTPEGAVAGEAWVPMIPGRKAVGDEADLYQGMPIAPNVIRAMSLVPDAVRTLRDLSDVHYLPMNRMTDLRAGRSLNRPQIELIAGRVSALNECFY